MPSVPTLPCSPPAGSVMAAKPARQLRTKWAEARERSDAPDPRPMPLQGLLLGEAAARFTWVHSREFSGTPVGQIVGSIDRVRPAKDVVSDMVDGWIDATKRVNRMMGGGTA